MRSIAAGSRPAAPRPRRRRRPQRRDARGRVAGVRVPGVPRVDVRGRRGEHPWAARPDQQRRAARPRRPRQQLGVARLDVGAVEVDRAIGRGASGRSVNASSKRADAVVERGAEGARTPSSFQPAPSPRTRRPPEISSTVAACFASMNGAWNAVAATSGPSATRSVASARPARVVHASQGPRVSPDAYRYSRWSPTQIESKPAVLGDPRDRAQLRPADLALDLGELDADADGPAGGAGDGAPGTGGRSCSDIVPRYSIGPAGAD